MVKKELPRRVFKKGRKPLGKIARKVREKRAAEQALQVIQQPQQYPKINRSITEWTAFLKNSFSNPTFLLTSSKGYLKNQTKIGLIWFVVIILGIGLIFWQAMVFSSFYPKYKQVVAKRNSLELTLKTWENLASRYPTYRDAHFEAALVAYQLLNKEIVMSEKDKTLEIDPNFALAKVLEGK